MDLERIDATAIAVPPLHSLTEPMRPGLDAVALAATSNASRRTVRARLQWIAKSLGFDSAAVVPWHALTPLHTAWIAARAIDRLAPDTARGIISALRGVLLQGWRLGVWSHDDHARLCDLPSPRGTREPRGRTLSAVDVERLAIAAGNDRRGARDRAALALLIGCGLRRDEAVRLTVDRLGPELRVLGKGNRERIVPVPQWAHAWLAAWLAVRGEWPGPVLCRVRHNDTIEPHGLTGTALYLAMDRLTQSSDVSIWSPHDGRRTFASVLLDATGDLSTTAAILGHVSTDTTRRYDLRSRTHRAAAVARIDRWVKV